MKKRLEGENVLLSISALFVFFFILISALPAPYCRSYSQIPSFLFYSSLGSSTITVVVNG